MKKNKFILLLVLGVFTASQAFASVGWRDEGGMTWQATDVNSYGCSESFDGSVVTHDCRASVITSGSIDGVTMGATTDNIIYRPLTVIASPAATTSAVATSNTGMMFVLTGTGGPVGGVGYILTLPGAAEGLNYTFTTATGQTVAVRSANSQDIIYYGSGAGTGVSNVTKITSPASSGSTVTLVGTTNAWYVASMFGTNATGNQAWTPGQR